MANLSITNTFVDGTTADADEVNTNFSDVRTYINARNGGSAKWDNVKSVAAITVDAASSQLVLGETTINAVDLASPLTYTIPDAGNTASFVMTEGAQTINGAKTLGAALAMGTNKITGLGNGTAAQDAATYTQVKILQQVRATHSTVATSSSSSYADTGLTVTITPVLSTSTIEIVATIPLRLLTHTDGVGAIDLAITDSSNNIIQQYLGAFATNDGGSGKTWSTTLTIKAYNAPGSTDAKTFKVRLARNTNQGGGSVETMYQGWGAMSGHISATEYR